MYIIFQTALHTAPILPHFDHPFMLEIDASVCAISAVLLHHISTGDSPLLPVAFYSKKLNAGEQKYPMHDHKMLAIIQACNKWNCYLIKKDVVAYTNQLQTSLLFTNATQA